MGAGCLLLVDYGEWFGPYSADVAASTLSSVVSGSAGGLSTCGRLARLLYRRTLRAYFRHQRMVSPYARVGRQDLTADVDFRALHLHGAALGFETVVFTTVSALLRAAGGEFLWADLASRASSSLDADREAAILGSLLDEESLGGAFKVLLQVREGNSAVGQGS